MSPFHCADSKESVTRKTKLQLVYFQLLYGKMSISIHQRCKMVSAKDNIGVWKGKVFTASLCEKFPQDQPVVKHTPVRLTIVTLIDMSQCCYGDKTKGAG